MAITATIASVGAVGATVYSDISANQNSKQAADNLNKTIGDRPQTPAPSEANAQRLAAGAKANNLRATSGYGGAGSTILTGGTPGLGNPQQGGKTLLGG